MFGSSFLFSAPSFPKLSSHTWPTLLYPPPPPLPSHTPPIPPSPRRPLSGVSIAHIFPSSLSVVADPSPSTHYSRPTSPPSRLSNVPVRFSMGPTLILRNIFPDMGKQRCKSFRACRNPRFVSLPILSLPQSAVSVSANAIPFTIMNGSNLT